MRIGPLLGRMAFVLLLLLIPTLLVIRFKWDAILPIIIYLQLLMIWAQAEIALRQHTLFTIQFKPFFSVRYQWKDFAPSPSIIWAPNIIWVRNTSKNAAYNIMVGRLLDKQNKPIPPDQWKDKLHSGLISSLSPDEEESLCSFVEGLAGSEFTIEFSYLDHLGEFGTMLVKLIKGRKILLIPETKEPPGILLSTFEYFALFFRFMRFKRHFRR